MRNILICFCLSYMCFYAQTPEKISYQAVIRNATNQLAPNQAIGMRVSVLQGSVNGAAVYVETHTKTTNTNGLVSLEIGNGQIVNGNFSLIDWSNGPFFIKTETDINGGTNYTITGTSQMLSVPYALYAKNAGNVANMARPTITTLTATNVSSNEATFNANLSGFGVVEKGFVWSTFNNPSALNSEKIIVPGSEWGNFSFRNEIIKTTIINGSVNRSNSSFNANSTYYYRAYVLTENNIYFYGESVPFTTLSVGQQGPAGGIVFYDKGIYNEGWRYLEVMPNDQNISPTSFGCNTLSVDNTSLSVGKGLINTQLLISACTQLSPAKLCDELIYGSFDDWFLPSALELYLMHFNLQFQNIGNLSGFYWSSTDAHNNPFSTTWQYSTQKAFVARSNVNNTVSFWDNTKSFLGNTRAVRYF
jgi:hypothetical protein